LRLRVYVHRRVWHGRTNCFHAQTGFRPNRFTIHSLFTTSVGLNKRKDHVLETWALFMDLTKAFDTMPRKALFAILCCFGSPDYLVNIVIHLNENAFSSKGVTRAFIPKARRIIIRPLGVTVCSCLCYLFNSSADLELKASYLFNHLRHIGLMMHIEIDTTLSKTEAIYFRHRAWTILMPTISLRFTQCRWLHCRLH
jgi:hypothetical protein